MHTHSKPPEESIAARPSSGRIDHDHRHDGDDGSVDIAVYIDVLWRRRLVITAVGAICAVVAIIFGVTSPRLYEAEASLAVSRPKISDAVDTTAVANFRPFVASRSVAALVIEEFGLNKPPYRFYASSFFGSVVTVDEVRNSTILLVKGTLDDPQLVTRVTNRVAALGVEAARRASQTEALQARDDMKLQLEESRTRMDQAEGRLQAFRETSQIEVLKEDINAALLERSGLLRLLIGIESDQSRLAKAEEELAARPRIDTVKRAIDSDPTLLESARKGAGGQTSDLLGLQLRSEVVNPVYETLDEEVAKTRTDLAGKQRQKAQMKARKLDTPHLAELNDLYKTEAELSRLEMERDLSRKVYLEVATSYETARLTVANRSSALQIVGTAGVPDRPVSRNVVRNTAMAFFAGLLVACTVVLLHGALTSATASPASRTV